MPLDSVDPNANSRDIPFRGELPVVKAGRTWYFRRADVDRWIFSRAKVLQ